MTPEQILRTYADLADLYDRQSQPKQRDWFLVLAADAANAAGKSADADRYLGRLLAVNPHHLLKPFGSFVEALRSPDVEGYVLSLRRSYPPDRAEQLLVTERNKILTASATAPSSPPPAREPPREPPPKPPAGPELFNTLAPQEPPRVIYARVRDEEQTPTAALPPVPPPPPAPPPPQPAPLPPRKVERAQPLPMPKPRPQPRAAEPPPEPEPAPTPPPRAAGRRRAAPPPEPEFDPGPEPSHEGSPFLPTVLFLVVLGFGLGLAAYAFVRPFLAPEWLR